MIEQRQLVCSIEITIKFRFMLAINSLWECPVPFLAKVVVSHKLFSKGLSQCFMYSDQHVKCWMHCGILLTSSLLLDFHVQQCRQTLEIIILAISEESVQWGIHPNEVGATNIKAGL